MNRRHFLATLPVIGVPAVASVSFGEGAVPMPRELKVPAITFSGPHTYSNLTVFLVHGKPTLKENPKLITLGEALDTKKLVVHETSTVNELSIENVSEDVDVFVQCGDIVKGGKQDRVIAMDMLITPKSGNLPLPSFCCEQGRWQQRGAEVVGRFTCSNLQASNCSLKIAVSRMDSQGRVWQEVADAQTKLSMKTGKDVTKNASPTSYQLALESKEVQEKIQSYVKELKGVAEGKSDVLGVSIVVNGTIRGIEWYGSTTLFSKLWTKLITGAAVDALSELEKDKKFAVPGVKELEQYLVRSELGTWTEMKPPAMGQRGRLGRVPQQEGALPNQQREAPQQQQQEVPPQQAQPPALPVIAKKDDPKPARLRIMKCESENVLTLESQDTLTQHAMVHRTYLSK